MVAAHRAKPEPVVSAFNCHRARKVTVYVQAIPVELGAANVQLAILKYRNNVFLIGIQYFLTVCNPGTAAINADNESTGKF